jgi:hypothetical protein
MVDVGIPFNGHILRPFNIFDGHVANFVVIWSPVLVCYTKNLATLVCRSGFASFGTEF